MRRSIFMTRELNRNLAPYFEYKNCWLDDTYTVRQIKVQLRTDRADPDIFFSTFFVDFLFFLYKIRATRKNRLPGGSHVAEARLID